MTNTFKFIFTHSSVVSGYQEKHQEILHNKKQEMLPKYQQCLNTSLKNSFRCVIAVLINDQPLGSKCSLMLKRLGCAIHEKSHSKNQTRFSNTNPLHVDKTKRFVVRET